MKSRNMSKSLLAFAISTAMAAPVTMAASDVNGNDFGAGVEHQLSAQSNVLFGVKQPLAESAQGSVAREHGQSADSLAMIAKGLHAEILTRQAGNKADMFVFWPNDINPTHTIWCIEGGRENLTDDGAPQLVPGVLDKYNPSVQAIDMGGHVTTLLRGMNRCDGIRRTAWGTILATEEADDGQAYEIIDPLSMENETVTDRTLGSVVAPDGITPSYHAAHRDALPTMSWEGLTVTGEGVVIAGDELRPGIGIPDKDGGAIFKFIPAVPSAGGEISDLADSPFVAGSVYAFRADCREDSSGSFPQYGQGCETGNGTWVSVTAANARDDANAAGATGYYRPEDLHADPTYEGAGLRFCWTNTGREAASNYGEVICGIDAEPMAADDLRATVVVNRFVEGDGDFNSIDNLAFQPHSGNLYVIEDHSNGDVFACLPDGADRDIKSDGCVKILSVRDQSAEPTGFAFTGDGRTAFLSVQHSGDGLCADATDCADLDDYSTDDIIRITGFRRFWSNN